MASPHWSEPAGAGGRPSGLRLCTGVETRWHTGAAAGTGRPGCERRSQEGAVRGASERGSACGSSWVCAEAGETARPVSALPQQREGAPCVPRNTASRSHWAVGAASIRGL